jgi:ABC-type proline/glycine betaine transport system ATPase subunit
MATATYNYNFRSKPQQNRERPENDMEITIKKFKKIDEDAVKLKPLNVFIGANNAGKSSFIQGIQFAISSCQTLELSKTSWTKAGVRTLSLDSSEFLYTPTRNIEYLYHGKKLTGAKTRKTRGQMEFVFNDGGTEAALSISKGKNGGFTTTVKGKQLGGKLSDIKKPFCVYVPGIAGIPTQEKYEVPITVRKSATRGDSNNYLRNILLAISKDAEKWGAFSSSVNAIYKNTTLSASFDENLSEFIDVNVKMSELESPFDENLSEFVDVDAKTTELELPLDAVGTGLLQVIQIFAYIEYFDPTIILLDEPDSHIHPTKQKLLAHELVRKTSENQDLKIVFSTHSRYILEALGDSANVVHFQNGKLFENVKDSNILLDIGAADADYLFKKQKLKFVIATEDKVDNLDEKKEFLRKLLLANGLTDDEFVLHSYEGCKKVDFAKILEGFVRKHIPTAQVVLHIDRDQKIDLDHDLLKLRQDCKSKEIKLFITKFQEIEAYFCTPEHISAIYDVPIKLVRPKYEEFVAELREETIRKLSDFIWNERPELALNKNNRRDSRKVETTVKEWYENHKYQLTPGKELLGKVKNYAQNELRKDPNEILNISKALRCPELQALLQ